MALWFRQGTTSLIHSQVTTAITGLAVSHIQGQGCLELNLYDVSMMMISPYMRHPKVPFPSIDRPLVQWVCLVVIPHLSN